MQTTVARVIKTFSHPNRNPVCYLELACGHSAKARFRPAILECDRCGWQRFENERPCPCGSRVNSFLRHVDEHRDVLDKVGDAHECAACDAYATQLEKLKAVLADQSISLSHTRWREGGSQGTVAVYRLDPTSPTGVILVMSIESTPEVNALLRGGLSPLSPTEGLRR